jgi:putative acetyltransferase
MRRKIWNGAVLTKQSQALRRRWQAISVAVVALLLLACSRSNPPSGFRVVRADRQITGSSAYPLAVDPDRVGTYPADTKSGAGYFYDQVLEYRVWLNPENGAQPLNGKSDYFVAFAQYEAAQEFSKRTPGADAPLVLVRQLEWINEPERGHFVPEKGERITEWQVKWLPDSERTERSIAEFMKHPKEAGP